MLLMADLPGNASVGFLSRQLGITRKSAVGLSNRIRLHMTALETPRTVGGWGRPVWIDETFIRLQGEISSTCIFGMKDERSLSLHIVPDRRALTLQTLIEETVISGSVLITDDFSSYRRLERLGWKHHRLNHSKRIWSDGEGRSTASIDLVWCWLKRDLAGRTARSPRMTYGSTSSTFCSSSTLNQTRLGRIGGSSRTTLPLNDMLKRTCGARSTAAGAGRGTIAHPRPGPSQT